MAIGVLEGVKRVTFIKRVSVSVLYNASRSAVNGFKLGVPGKGIACYFRNRIRKRNRFALRRPLYGGYNPFLIMGLQDSPFIPHKNLISAVQL